ncbi:hydroxycarboxylic acid receptor 2-like [Triplophysa dalaica]|uniref:hydroxycarboxylic acid receptor 2-like n=1 Tax=Triplophysa dalaica TaxID=1582913 RepID=UPI0024DFA30A|nr:hydroxycarboxylic acid receptor 2-like [Triplophysa dalaica]
MTPNGTERHCNLTRNQITFVLPPVVIIEMLLGLPGNIMALYVFCKDMPSWGTNVTFLFNLILSDFLLLLSLPFRIDNYLRDETWIFGDAWCRINLFMLAVNRSASIAFMTAVAFDRYFKVVHPHHKINYMTLKQAAGVACLIWAVVIALRIPLLANNLLKTDTNNSHCRSFTGDKDLSPGMLLHHGVFIIEFFVPLLLLIFCSGRITCALRSRQLDKGKRGQRAIRTVLVIVGVFILCFSPSIATMLTLLILESLGEKYCNAFKLTAQMFSLSIAFTYLNSALDPVIYCFSSSLFCNHLKKTLNRTGLVKQQLNRQGSMTSRANLDVMMSYGD